MSTTESRERGVKTVQTPVPHEGLLSIGDMARAFNVSQRTLRFYEDRGLLNPRRDGSSRLYGAQERRKLELILRGKRLGFTLTEIIGFVAENGSTAALTLDGEQISLQISHLERQREALDLAIAELKATQANLKA